MTDEERIKTLLKEQKNGIERIFELMEKHRDEGLKIDGYSLPKPVGYMSNEEKIIELLEEQKVGIEKIIEILVKQNTGNDTSLSLKIDGYNLPKPSNHR